MAEEVLFGADALGAMGDGNDGGKFTSLKSGTTLVVKAASMAEDTYVPALMSFFSYGIYNKVKSFVAKNPSVKSKKGYPTDNLTCWDKAWKFHFDQSEKFGDHHSNEAGKYKVKKRFAVAFIDLETGLPIVVDLSNDQATAVYAVLDKYKNKVGKLAFELSKTGSGTKTTVTLTPVIDAEGDLTDKQFKHFKEASHVVDKSIFEGVLYELDDLTMLQKLYWEAGFDVTKIGYEVPERPQTEGEGESEEGSKGPTEVPEDDLPF